MAFLGSAVGGLASGFGSGIDMAAKLQAMRQAQHEIMARQAAGQMLASPQGPVPQPPMPGAPSMPANGNTSPDPMMTQPMHPTQSADAMMGGGAPPMPPPGMGPPPDGAPPLPQAPAPMADPTPQPQTQTMGGPVGAGGDPLAGNAAGTTDPVQAAQDTIKNIAQQIKAANPDIQPEELFNATNLHIEQMKGVRNDVKDYMQQQIALANIQYKIGASENRLRGQLGAAGINANARVDAANIRGDASRDVAGTQAGARVEAANVGGKSRVEVANVNKDGRITAATTAADAARDVANTRKDSAANTAQQNRAGKENAGAFQSGSAKPKLVGYDDKGNAIYLNQGTKDKPGDTTTNYGGGAKPATPAKASAYKSADDVKAAFQAHKISQQQATTILQKQFGYQ